MTMTLNWLEMRRMSSARVRAEDQSRMVRLTRENLELSDENERLRQMYDALAASAEVWIRLYEAALARANAEAAARALLQEKCGKVGKR
ncbi:MAG TPA: hypothetical protein VD833_00210 [Vicinamibacterales bacterium]|nr:hypothetical protein [Vicinamibacterales bacterium]